MLCDVQATGRNFVPGRSFEILVLWPSLFIWVLVQCAYHLYISIIEYIIHTFFYEFGQYESMTTMVILSWTITIATWNMKLNDQIIGLDLISMFNQTWQPPGEDGCCRQLATGTSCPGELHATTEQLPTLGRTRLDLAWCPSSHCGWGAT